MALPVLLFLSILLATFVLVVAMTRPSPQEKTMDQRMALIHKPKNKAGATPETEQLFKATSTGRFGWLDEILERYQFAQTLQKHILQANSSTTVSATDPVRPRLVPGRICNYLALRAHAADRYSCRSRAGLAAIRNSFLQKKAKNQRLQRSACGVHRHDGPGSACRPFRRRRDGNAG